MLSRMVLSYQFYDEDWQYVYFIFCFQNDEARFLACPDFNLETDDECSKLLKYLLKWSKSGTFGIPKSSQDSSKSMKRSFGEI